MDMTAAKISELLKVTQRMRTMLAFTVFLCSMGLQRSASCILGMQLPSSDRTYLPGNKYAPYPRRRNVKQRTTRKCQYSRSMNESIRECKLVVLAALLLNCMHQLEAICTVLMTAGFCTVSKVYIRIQETHVTVMCCQLTGTAVVRILCS